MSDRLLPLVYTGGPLATNAYLIPNADQTTYVGIDAPEGLATELRENGIGLEALLLTHGHSDHVADAARIARDHRCPVCVHADDLPPLPPDSVIRLEVPNGQGNLEIGGLHFDLFHVPGHSPGSIAFHERDRRRLFSGDLIFTDGIGRCRSAALRVQLLDGIARWILPLPDETEIYPGHGSPTFLGTERCRDYFHNLNLHP